MYQAELRGKLSRDNENKEDILTSNVFSFFMYASRSLFLLPFLHSLGLYVTDSEAAHAKFHFWPSYFDKTEPDLVVLVGKYYLLFEAKYHSGFDKGTKERKHQLEREYEQGILEAQTLGLDFHLIIVSADSYLRPVVQNEIPAEYQDQIRWINWQKIAFFLFDILNSNKQISAENRLFAEDLYQLLVKKHLRNFEGVGVLSNILLLHPVSDQIFFEASTASYRGDFIGFDQALDGFHLMRDYSNTLFFSNRKSSNKCFFEDLASSNPLKINQNEVLFYSRRENHG